MSEKRTECKCCGAWGPANQYHPYAFCLLVKARGGDTKAARIDLNSVIDWGRRLERAKLPNSASIARVPFAAPRSGSH